MHNKLLRPITTIAGLDCLSNEQISKIRLQEAVDFTIYTEFDDEDLIELWKEFLYSIRAARLFKKSSVRTVGGGRRNSARRSAECPHGLRRNGSQKVYGNSKGRLAAACVYTDGRFSDRYRNFQRGSRKSAEYESREHYSLRGRFKRKYHLS